ncbi:MAG: hypothetical protein LBB13_03130 [Rickettsiales bacterium]|jgi:hypothetical protein|nr:hypothetical protein [Rickettsiales bacterium]
MKILKKVKIKLKDGGIIRRFYLFKRYPIFQHTMKNGRGHFSWFKKTNARKDQRVFYLKVNRPHCTAYQCVQQWLDIAEAVDAFCYFVCDDRKMELGIFKNVKFSNLNFRFIKSDRKTLKSTVKKVLESLSGRYWWRATYAMLTPFLHMIEHNFSSSYNIDADDLRILLAPDKIKNILQKVEEYAEEKELDCFDLDIYPTRTFGTHWSFGVVYVRTPEKCLEAIKNNKDWRRNTALIEKYKTEYVLESKWEFRNDTIDWVFSFLRDTEQLRLQTFYVENLRVVHMPDRLLDYWWPFILHWHDNNLFLPLLHEFYNEKLWGTLPIADGVVKIDVGLTDEDFYTYMHKNVPNVIKNDFFRLFIETAKLRGKVNEDTYVKYRSAIKV